MNLNDLLQLFVANRCTKLYAKTLAENDNSKNQVYFAGTVEALNIFPSREVFATNTKSGPSFKAALNFGWLQNDGTICDAPGAQLILYSQYPEVRFSGFLFGCKRSPSALMNEDARISGRILFLGVVKNERVIGFVVAPDSEIAAEFRTKNWKPSVGIFVDVALPTIPNDQLSRLKLLEELRRINRLGWIVSKQLHSNGSIGPCDAPQCGGFTLEAELGIPKNSAAEPDYLGWEVKQHAVSSFEKFNVGTITLMTPEPTGGFYKDKGVDAFVRRFGYPDKNDVPDRLNFGGIHTVGNRQETTGLTLHLDGYDAATRKITDANGCLALKTAQGEIAASWAFTGLLKHWSRKHTKAVYVPSLCQKEPVRKYSYGPHVRLAQGTNPLHLLKAFAECAVYYDPGIKLERASTSNPISKRRSQFRIRSKAIGCLYEKMETVDL